ncbi:MAG: hypothetical protein ACREK5_04445, partial [Gemmatimonadota bacterium]
RRIVPGAVAGILGGLVFGIMMQNMTAPTPEGMRMPMMAMVAMVVGSTSIAVGWAYHLVNSAVIGGLYGLLIGGRLGSVGGGLGWGAVWGFVWWVLGGLILMPLLLGMPAFASLQMPEMRMVAVGSLVGHLVYGLVLGATYAKLGPRTPTRPVSQPLGRH